MGKSAGVIRLFVMDASSAFRGMVANHFDGRHGLKVVGSVHNVAGMASWFSAHEADVAIIHLAEKGDYELVDALEADCPNLRVIRLIPDEEQDDMSALRRGACTLFRPNLRDLDAKDHFFTQLDLAIARFFHLPPADVGVAARLSSAPVTYPNLTPKILAVGSSTGGPQALVELFRAIGGRLSHVPIVITQHMPPHFTTILAGHVQDACGQPTIVPESGALLEAGKIYVAPGDYHMVIKEEGGNQIVRLNQDAPVNFCRPAVDVMVNSLVPIYGERLLIAMLTGMGQDGLESSVLAKEKGATIIAQDQETSVVWGMPGAVAKAEICSAILPLKEMAPYILKAFGRSVAS